MLILKGKEVLGESLMKRRGLIEKNVLPTLANPIRYSPILEGWEANLCRASSQRLHSGITRSIVQENQVTGNEGMPVR